jgi:hypothetical protein
MKPKLPAEIPTEYFSGTTNVSLLGDGANLNAHSNQTDDIVFDNRNGLVNESRPLPAHDSFSSE